MYLKNKFYVFLELFYYSLDRYNVTIFHKIMDHLKTMILYLYNKYSKKVSRNIKFGLQKYFNMEIILNSLNRRFEL